MICVRQLLVFSQGNSFVVALCWTHSARKPMFMTALSAPIYVLSLLHILLSTPSTHTLNFQHQRNNLSQHSTPTDQTKAPTQRLARCLDTRSWRCLLTTCPVTDRCQDAPAVPILAAVIASATPLAPQRPVSLTLLATRSSTAMKSLTFRVAQLTTLTFQAAYLKGMEVV